MAPVFVDTGAWIAMAVVRDQFHKEYDDGHAKSVKFHSLIQEAVKARKLKLEWVTPKIHQEAWDIFEDYADQVFSFVDCTSFVIARHAGIKEVFAFDQHFNTMGFMLRP